jgi:hypothetical protein
MHRICIVAVLLSSVALACQEAGLVIAKGAAKLTA